MFTSLQSEWNSFLRQFVWKQGEHVAVIAPTGWGKSTIAFEIIKKRKYVVILGTKPRDKTLSDYIKTNDYEDTQKWPPGDFTNKIALWPRFKTIDSFDTQRSVFKSAINGYGKIQGLFQQGGWTIVIDEVMYFREELQLDKEMRMLWTQGRSNDLSVVASAQRPRDIPLLMLNQSTHLFLGRFSDVYEIRRISEIGGEAGEQIKQYLPRLKEYEYFYVNTRTGKTAITKAKL
jgi:hypothetical protein